MEASAPSQWVENRRSSGLIGRGQIAELWAHRELALLFAWREAKLRYKQTALGIAWVLLQPLLTMILFTALLARAVDIPSDGVPYAVFAYVGLAAWTGFSTAISRASESLTQDPNLVTKVFFPRLLVPIGVILPAALDITVALALAAPLMLVYGAETSPALVLLPLCIVWLLFVAAAVGAWLSALNVLYRDVRYAMTFALQIWLLATPVLFPSAIIEGSLRPLLFLNPAAGPIEAVRASVVGTPLYIEGAMVSLGALVVVGLTGFAYFHRVNRQFADRI